MDPAGTWWPTVIVSPEPARARSPRTFPVRRRYRTNPIMTSSRPDRDWCPRATRGINSGCAALRCAEMGPASRGGRWRAHETHKTRQPAPRRRPRVRPRRGGAGQRRRGGWRRDDSERRRPAHLSRSPAPDPAGRRQASAGDRVPRWAAARPRVLRDSMGSTNWRPHGDLWLSIPMGSTVVGTTDGEPPCSWTTSALSPPRSIS